MEADDDARRDPQAHQCMFVSTSSATTIRSIKAIAKQAGIPMVIRFITMDQGLERVLSNIRIVETNLRDAHGAQMKLRYLPGLFPELDHAGYCALMTKLTS